MSRSMAAYVLIALLLATPLSAQDTAGTTRLPAPTTTAEEAIATARSLFTVIEPEADPCAAANPDPDTIVVCRQYEDGAQYMLQSRTRADSDVTGSGAPRAPDFNDSCLATRGRENCMMFGSVPPPAIMVDFSLLPETPEGSEAARLYGGPTDADAVTGSENGQTPAP